MALEQHTSVARAITLAPPWFLLCIWTMEEIPPWPDNLHIIERRMNHYLVQAIKLLDKPRTGWTRKERGIPPEHQETIGAHMIKVSLAAHKVITWLSKWHFLNLKAMSPELQELYDNDETWISLPRKWFFHDFIEWGKNPDLTPGEKTKDEQDEIEYAAALEYAKVYWDDFPLKMYQSLLPKNLENEILFNLDKIDAAVMALNYKRLGYEVEEFFSYTRSKLTISMMKEILEILIAHCADYPDIDAFIQYDSLLSHGWNMSYWRRDMDARMEYGNAAGLMLRMQWMQARWEI